MCVRLRAMRVWVRVRERMLFLNRGCCARSFTSMSIFDIRDDCELRVSMVAKRRRTNVLWCYSLQIIALLLPCCLTIASCGSCGWEPNAAVVLWPIRATYTRFLHTYIFRENAIATNSIPNERRREEIKLKKKLVSKKYIDEKSCSNSCN